jgi:hypothetical protein
MHEITLIFLSIIRPIVAPQAALVLGSMLAYLSSNKSESNTSRAFFIGFTGQVFDSNPITVGIMMLYNVDPNLTRHLVPIERR